MATAVASSALAASPGMLITNTAACEFLAPAGASGGQGSSPDAAGLVLSNTVVTPVTVAPALSTLVLDVTPPGTVAPGTLMSYTLDLANSDAADLVDVTVRLPLDLSLSPPSAFTDGSVPLASGGALPISASYDPGAHAVTWFFASLPAAAIVRLRLDAGIPADTPSDTIITMSGRAQAPTLPGFLESNTALTPVVAPVLAVTKRALQPSAIPGDAVTFEITVTHTGTAPALASVNLIDDLPAGLSYADGSLRVDGLPASLPILAGDGRLMIPLGALPPGGTRSVHITAVVGPVSRTGDVINRARAEAVTAAGAALVSPYASALVRVVPGPFRREANLLGRVFIDQDRDGLPGAGEPGVPGVFVYMEDGRGAVTDITGRWHLEGVRPGLHVARLDTGSLPAGLRPRAPGPDWAGDPDTRFLEVRASTLVVADFPLGPDLSDHCRFRAGEEHLGLAADSLLDPLGNLLPAAAGHLESLAALFAQRGARARGEITVSCSRHGADELQPLLAAALGQQWGEPGASRGDSGAGNSGAELTPAESLEAVVRSASPQPAILSPPSGHLAGRSVLPVEVVYPSTSRPELTVNGRPVPARQIGTSSILPSRGVAAARYIGVPLEAGVNHLRFAAIPQDGSAAPPSVETTIILPGPPVALRLSVPGSSWVADGRTPGTLLVEAVDAAGQTSSSDTTVDLVIEGARPAGADHDPRTPGHQLRLRTGAATLTFHPQVTPGRVHILATARGADAELIIPVLPAAGRWQVTGLAEGRLAGDAGIEGDGGMAPGLDDGITEDGGRLALHARGPVGKSSRLTVALDTEKDRDRERLSGPHEPDLFFPVSGDTSERIDESQSQGPLFARLDGPRGFLLWGDFATALDRTHLGRYDRRLSGLSGQARSERLALSGFAAPSGQQSVRDIFPPDGTSGPFLLSRHPLVARSETVILETRDRFRSDTVLSRQVRQRDLDYRIDTEAGTLLFTGPVQPFDADFNPVRVIIIYEVPGHDDQRVTAGGRLGFQATESLQAGVSAVREERAGEDLEMAGIDVQWRPVPGTTVRAEMAALDEGQERTTAYEMEITSRPLPELEWEISYRNVPVGFVNPTLLSNPETGSRRASAAALWTPSAAWRIKGEAFMQDDERTSQERRTAGLEAVHTRGEFTATGGLRLVESDGPAMGPVNSVLLEGGVRGRLAQRWLGEITRRQALGDDTAPGYPTRTAAGLAFEVRQGTKAILRHERESGDGPDVDRTVLGLESQVGRAAKAFSRYALEEGISGASLRASSGVETTFNLGQGSSINFSAARVDTTSGDGSGDFTTVAAGYERRAGPSLLTGRYEISLGQAAARHLLTGAGSVRLSEPWTLFLRENLSLLDADNGGVDARAEGLLGAAYRPLGGRLRFLARMDHSTSAGSTPAVAGVVPGTVLSEPAASATRPPGATSPTGLGIGFDRTPPGSWRDSMAVSLAAGAGLTARQRLAASLTFRLVDGDAAAGLPSTFTDLISLHYTASVHPRWTLGGSLRRFSQEDTSNWTMGAGLEVGYLAGRNIWLTGGYNFAGFAADAIAGAGRTDAGAFFSVRLKFDENNLLPWRDLRLDQP